MKTHRDLKQIKIGDKVYEVEFHENPQGFETYTSMKRGIVKIRFHENPQGFETKSKFCKCLIHSYFMKTHRDLKHLSLDSLFNP